MSKKFIVSASISIALLVGSVVPVFASTPFSNVYVDSNQWSYVEESTKTGTTKSYVSVYLSRIDTGGGNASNYKYIRVNIKSGSVQASSSTNTKIEKGKTEDIPLEAKYNVKNYVFDLYAKGNDPSLDCIIYGSFDAN